MPTHPKERLVSRRVDALRCALLFLVASSLLVTEAFAEAPVLRLDAANAAAISNRIDAIVSSATARAGGSSALIEFERLGDQLKDELGRVVSALEAGDRRAARDHAGRAKSVLIEMSFLARQLNVSLTAREQAVLERFLRSS